MTIITVHHSFTPLRLAALHREFPGGFQDQRDGTVALLQGRLRHDVNQRGQQKRQGLAAACRGAELRQGNDDCGGIDIQLYRLCTFYIL